MTRETETELGRGLLTALAVGVLVVLLNGGGIVGAVLGVATVLLLGAMALHADRQIRRDHEAHERLVRDLDRKRMK